MISDSFFEMYGETRMTLIFGLRNIVDMAILKSIDLSGKKAIPFDMLSFMYEAELLFDFSFIT